MSTTYRTHHIIPNGLARERKAAKKAVLHLSYPDKPDHWLDFTTKSMSIISLSENLSALPPSSLFSHLLIRTCGSVAGACNAAPNGIPCDSPRALGVSVSRVTARRRLPRVALSANFGLGLSRAGVPPSRDAREISKSRRAAAFRLFASGLRPATLTACPPREPPPLFEQEPRRRTKLADRGIAARKREDSAADREKERNIANEKEFSSNFKSHGR